MGDEDNRLFNIVAEIVAGNQEEAWKLVEQFYPKYKYRFCYQVALDWTSGSRLSSSYVRFDLD